MSDLVIPEPLRSLLVANLLEERDLAESLRLSDVIELEHRPGRFTCRCMVPVRRAFDPETAEIKRLDLDLKRHESGGWQVVAIRGLDDPSASAD